MYLQRKENLGNLTRSQNFHSRSLREINKY